MQIGALLISAHSFHEIPQDLWEATDIRHSIDEAPAMSNVTLTKGARAARKGLAWPPGVSGEIVGAVRANLEATGVSLVRGKWEVLK